MDIQLSNTKTPTMWLFIEQEIVDGDLSFKIETARWNAEHEENDIVRIEHIPADKFSAWWSRQIGAGWKIVTE